MQKHSLLGYRHQRKNTLLVMFQRVLIIFMISLKKKTAKFKKNKTIDPLVLAHEQCM